MNPLKLAVVVLDGGTWRNMTSRTMPWMRSAIDYPAELFSPQPITVPSFQTLFTGVLPEVHGVTGWLRPDGSLVRSTDLQVPYIWESDAWKHSYGLVSFPLTFPIKVTPNLKFAMCGFDAPMLDSAAKVVHPLDLDTTGMSLDVLHEIRVNPQTEQQVVSKRSIYYHSISMMALRFLRTLEWCRRYTPDVLFITVSEWDRMAHFCYRQKPLLDTFLQILDKQLQWFLYQLYPQRVIIMSDHGFCDRDDPAGAYYCEHEAKGGLGPNMEGVHDQLGIFATINSHGDTAEGYKWAVNNQLQPTQIVGIISEMLQGGM